MHDRSWARRRFPRVDVEQTGWRILVYLGNNGDPAAVRHDTKGTHEQELRKG